MSLELESVYEKLISEEDGVNVRDIGARDGKMFRREERRGCQSLLVPKCSTLSLSLPSLSLYSGNEQPKHSIALFRLKNSVSHKKREMGKRVKNNTKD